MIYLRTMKQDPLTYSGHTHKLVNMRISVTKEVKTEGTKWQVPDQIKPHMVTYQVNFWPGKDCFMKKTLRVYYSLVSKYVNLRKKCLLV